MKKLLGIVVLGLLFIFAWNSLEAKAEDFKLTKITENLKSPWSLSFINQNEALVTEKSGNIIYINIEKQELKNIKHNLKVLEHGTMVQREMMKIRKEGKMKENCVTDTHKIIYEAEKRVGKKNVKK